MKKLALKLDGIEVESFPTAGVPDAKGTVEAQFASRYGDTWCVSCFDETCLCNADPNLRG